MSLDLGSLLRERRQSLGLKQTVLAKRLGMSQSAISKLERNQIHPSYVLLRRVMEELGLGYDDLSLAESTAEPDWYGVETLRQLELMRNYGHYRELLELADSAMEAEFFKDARQRGVLQYWKSEAYNGLTQSHEAIECCLEFLKNNRSTSDRFLLAKVYVSLGHAYQDLKRFPEAQIWLEEALQLFHAIPRLALDSSLQSSLFYYLAGIYKELGLTDKAETYLRRLASVDFERRYFALKRCGDTLASLGDIALARGDLETALRYYLDASRHDQFISYQSRTKKLLERLKDVFVGAHTPREAWSRECRELAHQLAENILATTDDDTVGHLASELRSL